MEVLLIVRFAVEILKFIAQFVSLLVCGHRLLDQIHDEFFAQLQFGHHLLPNLIEFRSVIDKQLIIDIVCVRCT